MADPQTTASDVRVKLAKLLRMLTSNHDGEVLSAAAKINGIVAAYGLDWDAALQGGSPNLSREQMVRLYEEGKRDGYQEGLKAAGTRSARDEWAPAGTPRTGEIGNRYDEVIAMLNAAGKALAEGRLSDFERGFASSMLGRLDDWGRRAFVSDKQWAVIDRLQGKLQRMGYLP